MKIDDKTVRDDIDRKYMSRKLGGRDLVSIEDYVDVSIKEIRKNE